jgi:hypothetical protein
LLYKVKAANTRSPIKAATPVAMHASKSFPMLTNAIKSFWFPQSEGLPRTPRSAGQIEMRDDDGGFNHRHQPDHSHEGYEHHSGGCSPGEVAQGSSK